MADTPRVTVPVADLERVRDLLMERIYGSPARSPAHNARLEVEAMLSAAPAPEGGAVDWSYDLTSCPRSEPFLIAYADGDVRMGHYLDNSKSSVPWEGIRPLFGAERWDAKIVAWAKRPALATREEAPNAFAFDATGNVIHSAYIDGSSLSFDPVTGIISTREEAPAEAGEIGAEYDAAAHCVTLAECPPGLFLWNGTLGFKSEYGAMEPDEATNGKHWKVGNRADAYCADSGEYFWGGASNHDDRAKLLVYPIDAETVAMVASHGPSALRAQPQAREEAQPVACYDCATDRPHLTTEACAPPAPEAEKLRDHLEWIETVLTDPLPDYTARIATAREFINQALAALQQGGRS